MKIVLMASGKGTNVLNLIEYANKLKKVEIAGVIVNKKSSSLLTVDLTIPIFYIPKTKMMSRADHEAKIIEKINSLDAQYILLCGYMSILSAEFINHFKNSNSERSNILNIHPSLLPEFKGENAYEHAFNSKVKISGITVHFVDEHVDHGEIFVQNIFERSEADSLEDFITRGKKIEWEIYPLTLDWLENL